jgi:uncharacterized membrane protein YkoI
VPRRGDGCRSYDYRVKRLLAIAGLSIAAFVAAIPAAAAPMTLQEAIAKVERETGAKVLSAETKGGARQKVYRIKVLTRDGQVRVIDVPAGE